MSGNTFVKSTLVLTIATLLSKILGSAFRIPLQNIAGDEVLGIFTLVYPVYMVALILSVAGIPIAISKLIAEARATGEMAEIREIRLTASILAILFGIVSFLLIYTLSPFIAEALGGESTRLALIISSATLLVAPFMAVYRGYFQGFDDMRPTGTSQVLEQFIRVGFILVIAYYLVKGAYADEFIAGWIMIGSVFGAFGSLIYLLIKYKRSNIQYGKMRPYKAKTFKRWGKTILAVSIPIAFGSITMALLNFVDSFTIPFSLRSAGTTPKDIIYLLGIYGRGLSLVQIATVFATSIVLPLIPLITKQLISGNHLETRATIEKANQLTHLVSWPAAIGLVALTVPMNLALFTNTEGSLMLLILNLSSVFTSLTVLGTGILQGMNTAKLAAWIIIGGVLLKVITNIVFVGMFGLNGAAISTLLVYIILFIINTRFIYKKMTFTILSKQTIKMIVASLVMGIVIGVPTLLFDIENWSRLIALIYVGVMVVIGGGIYFAQLFIYKAVDPELTGKLPIIGKYFRKEG